MLNILVTMVLKLSTCWLAAAHNSTDSKSCRIFPHLRAPNPCVVQVTAQ